MLCALQIERVHAGGIKGNIACAFDGMHLSAEGVWHVAMCALHQANQKKYMVSGIPTDPLFEEFPGKKLCSHALLHWQSRGSVGAATPLFQSHTSKTAVPSDCRYPGPSKLLSMPELPISNHQNQLF